MYKFIKLALFLLRQTEDFKIGLSSNGRILSNRQLGLLQIVGYLLQITTLKILTLSNPTM
ncbi:hypothetical protein LEP1GSC039_1819 [Leptospira santarosai str. 2000027870]|nr:hypothetical protein LEP1GSC039_1819 [Leptospira santarosai str. 2000027870]